MKKFSVFLFLLLFSFCLNLTAGGGDSAKPKPNAGTAPKPSVVKKNIEVIINGINRSTITIDSGGIVPDTIWKKYKPLRPCDSLIIDTSRVQQDDKIFVDYVPGFVFNGMDSLSVRIDSLTVRIAKLEDYPSINNNLKWLWGVSLFLFALIVATIVVLVVKQKCLFRKNIVYEDNFNKFADESLKLREDLMKDITKKLKSSSPAIDQSVDFQGLVSRIDALECQIKNKSETHTSKPQPSQSSTLFAKSISDGTFNRIHEVPGDDSFFELKLHTPNKAQVTICRNAYRKILSNPAFLEGCDKNVMGSNEVQIVAEGEAVKEPDGRWRVIRKIRVNLK